MTIHRKQPKTVIAISTPRWLGYATAAAATAVLGHAGTAEASVDVFLVNETFNAPPNSSVSASFALGKGGAGFSVNQVKFNNGEGLAAAFPYGGALVRAVSNYVAKLALGDAIEGGGFINGGSLANADRQGKSQWQTAGTGYLGFQFTDAGGAETGWAEITIDMGQPDNTFTLDEYAYSTAGESLTAGEVPEPGSLALLAVGGAGLLAWRQRRAARA